MIPQYQNTKLDLYIQCRNGHYGCSKCFNKLKTCPMCRVALRYKIKSFSPEPTRIAKIELKRLGAAQSFDSQKIGDMFKCTVCCNVPTANPLWQCSNGHIKCETCSRFYRSPCPLCFEKPIFSMALQGSYFTGARSLKRFLKRLLNLAGFNAMVAKKSSQSWEITKKICANTDLTIIIHQ